MQYQCKICGYIYDEDKEAVKFDDLPSDWTCPLCGASKSEFEMIGTSSEETKKKINIVVDEDSQELTIGQLAALCSSLSRGCEKQYKEEEAFLYKQLSEYFNSIEPKSAENEIEDLVKKLEEDITINYKQTVEIAKQNNDRGTQRVCVWGEKVTRILNGLLLRYQKEGDSFLNGKKIYVCTVCGFVFVGDSAPELCPVCKVPSWKFELVEGRN